MLRMSVSDLAAIRRHGEATYPNECCGILLGSVEGGTRSVGICVCCDNVHPTPRHRYRVDARQLTHAQREARERGLQIVGFYHSHPDHSAHWSAADLDEAYWPGCSNVIIAVDNGKATDTKSFVLTGSGEDKALIGEEIVVAEN